jgi:hypothetical protein
MRSGRDRQQVPSVSAEARTLTGHHVVRILNAVIDVIHDVGELRFTDGLQPADLEEVG